MKYAIDILQANLLALRRLGVKDSRIADLQAAIEKLKQ